MRSKQKKPKKYLIYTLIFLAMCITPLVTTPFYGNMPSGENNIVKAFASGYGLKAESENAAKLIESNILKQSPSDEVIIGQKGWLFSKDTLADFEGQQTLSDQDINNANYNLETLQKTLNKKGINFLFTIAPNKNSIYGRYMPRRYTPDTMSRNSSRFRPNVGDVNYLDIFWIFTEKEMYPKTSSTWSDEGAYNVANEILKTLGKKENQYDTTNKTNDFKGNLADLINSKSSGTEPRVSFPLTNTNSMDENGGYETHSAIGSGSYQLIGDEFSSNLYPFISERYENGYYSTGYPFDFSKGIKKKCDDIILEVSEKNMYNLVKDAPILDTKVNGVKIPKKVIGGNTYPSIYKQNEKFTRISGNLPDSSGDVYVALKKKGENTVLRAFKTTNNTFTVYTSMKGTYDALLISNGQSISMGTVQL